MSKNAACRKIPALVLGIFLLCLATQARGQELTVTPASESVKAGDGVSMWLNTLNTSSNDISWPFPTRIESEMISAQGTFDGLLALQPEETNAVMIAPGTFARREYIFTVAVAVAGQVVLESPRLRAGLQPKNGRTPPRLHAVPVNGFTL